MYEYIGLHVKYPLFLSDFNPLSAELNPICQLQALLEAHHILHVSGLRVNETWIFSTGFQKIPCGRVDGHRQTDMMKLRIAFRHFANATANTKHNISGKKGKGHPCTSTEAL